MEKEKNHLVNISIVAIVGIVAIFGLVVIVRNNAAVYSGEDLAGAAFSVSKACPSSLSCRSPCYMRWTPSGCICTCPRECPDDPTCILPCYMEWTPRGCVCVCPTTTTTSTTTTTLSTPPCWPDCGCGYPDGCTAGVDCLCYDPDCTMTGNYIASFQTSNYAYAYTGGSWTSQYDNCNAASPSVPLNERICFCSGGTCSIQSVSESCGNICGGCTCHYNGDPDWCGP
ncbi:hypothetical protein JW930_05935 [Candidatus Woesearchaeota archaeon]|nr:hypothetical protein [Candidatus Woesearchaeota archaeon]